MASWKDKLNGDPVPWLLEIDKSQPGVRYFTLCDILGWDKNDKEVKAAKATIMESGPVPVILAAQQPEGYWGKRPRYTGTLPAIVCMAQFGADGADPRIRAGCEILLSRYIDNGGGQLPIRLVSDFYEGGDWVPILYRIRNDDPGTLYFHGFHASSQ